MSYTLIFVFIAIASASAAAALIWAIQSGQFRDISAGAATIFDDEASDPEPRDSFPKDNHVE